MFAANQAFSLLYFVLFVHICKSCFKHDKDIETCSCWFTIFSSFSFPCVLNNSGKRFVILKICKKSQMYKSVIHTKYCFFFTMTSKIWGVWILSFLWITYKNVRFLQISSVYITHARRPADMHLAKFHVSAWYGTI